MSNAIDELIAQINADKGRSSGSIIARACDAHGLDFTRIDTGNISMNILCGGSSLDGGETITWGIPRGRITEVYGNRGSGKTTLALHTLKSVQSEGECGAFVTSEGSWDTDWAENIGIDLSELIVARVSSVESAIDIISRLIETPGIGLIVVDSVAMLLPAKTAGIKATEELVQPGLQARLINLMVSIITASLNTWDITAAKTAYEQPAILLLNQLREKIGVMYGNPNYAPGGRAKEFQASIRIETSTGQVIKADSSKDATPIGMELKAKCVKNKTWPPNFQCEYKFYSRETNAPDGHHPAGEPDRPNSLLRCAELFGLVERGGSSYKFGDTKVTGRDNFLKTLSEDSKLSEELERDVYQAAWDFKGFK